MKLEAVTTTAICISGAGSLDPIHVFWVNVEPGKGYITAICYGSAWTAYFGAMNGQTIQQFVAEVDADYLTTKMGYAPTLKHGKQQMAYLRHIVDAIILAAAAAQSTGPQAAQAPKEGNS